jgi:hypothetical protein
LFPSRYYLRSLYRLGWSNLARVFVYRVGLKFKIHPVLHIKAEVPNGIFFKNVSKPHASAIATSYWLTHSRFFSCYNFPLSGIPNWYFNPFNQKTSGDAEKHWSKISDFDSQRGDIKITWEASRFDWVIAMAQRANLGQTDELDRLNVWIANWIDVNRPYNGPNWKCGQEASIRVMHLAVAAIILGNTTKPTIALRQLVELHLKRIFPTTGYAIGQQNNHGTSEAAALFIGGSWLESLGDKRAMRYRKAGLKLLQNRAKVLIAEDGSFSQQSLVYHRLMLDTYCIAETWRAHRELPRFDAKTYQRLEAATFWLQHFTDTATGDGPNLGANDGARLMPLSETDFRDFRSTLQLAFNLFCKMRAVAARGSWDQPAFWLRLEESTALLPVTKSKTFDDGGYHVLKIAGAVVYLRYPRYKFRPGQCDALHVDFWVDGRNILKDSGSFSYNAPESEMQYFNGNSGHNTIEFDDRNQMPRVGRFLLGEWLKAENVEPVRDLCGVHHASAGYVDYMGARHIRKVSLQPGILTCFDEVSGHAKLCKIRWRLDNGPWKIEGNSVSDGKVKLVVSSPSKAINFRIVTGYESRHYLEKTEVQVVEFEVKVPAEIKTEIRF